MKKATIARELGYSLMKKWRVPYFTHQGSLSKAPNDPNNIRLKEVSSFKEFLKYYNVTVKPKYKKLSKAMKSRQKYNPWKSNNK